MKFSIHFWDAVQERTLASVNPISHVSTIAKLNLKAEPMVDLPSSSDSDDDARDATYSAGVGQVRCCCGKIVVVETSWSLANPGRRSVVCRRAEGTGVGCGLNEWVDPEFTKRSIHVINELIRKNERLEAQIEEVSSSAMDKDIEIRDLTEELRASKEDILLMRKRMRDLHALLSDAKGMCLLG